MKRIVLFIVFLLALTWNLEASHGKQKVTQSYISQDPIGIEGGFNMYGYVEDTNTWVDIFGLSGFFTPSTFQAPSVADGGTGHLYKTYEQDIDWNATFNKKGGGVETNLDKAMRGDAPLVKKNGKWEVINLHHSRQRGSGPLFELSQSTHLHTTNKNGRKALHPFSPNKHPLDPVGDRKIFKVDKEAYWKNRADAENAKRSKMNGHH